MATYHSCRNCGNSEEGDKIYQCRECGKVFCKDCASFALFGALTGEGCPACEEGTGDSLGRIESED